MARYVVVGPTTPLYEPSEKVPLINLFAALVWAIAFMQKVFPSVDGVKSLVMGAVFIIVFWIVCLIPIVAIIPAVASGIVYAVMFWALADKIGHDGVRIVVKVFILLLDIFLEFCVVCNATFRWLQDKFPEKPRVRKIED